MTNVKEVNSLKFKFDVSAYRLIGRELITDRITALFELVKNCYDANAENVFIDFLNINPATHESKIIIRDDGIGMTFEDIRDKWMVIGTSSKRKNTKSPAPYFRKVVGKKGIGRFAVDKLGAKLLLKTKKVGQDQNIYLETDWSYYAQQEKQQLELDFTGEKKLFTDVENRYWFESADASFHGTTLEISGLADVWTENDINRAVKELSKLIRPHFTQKYPFRVFVNAPQYSAYMNRQVESQAIEEATLTVELGFNQESRQQEILIVENGNLKKVYTSERPCGLVGLTIHYYDQKAKTRFNKLTDDRIDGIKVYRDGLIATPFAEYAENRNEQKDLFGIDKRRWSGFFDKLSTRDLLGWVDISEERNPNIIDATNRQDFVDNDAWRELKALVIEQIQRIEDSLKKQKTVEREKSKSEFNDASQEIGTIRQEINKIIQSPNTTEENKKQLENVSKKLSKAQASVNKSLSDYQKLEEEKRRQEELLFSLVSLQTYASMLSHITRTSIGRIKRPVEYIAKWINSEDKKEKCLKHSQNTFKEMNNLDKAVDFMLKYAKDDQHFEDINVRESIAQTFDIYSSEFMRQGIKVTIDMEQDVTIRYNPKAFEDMFDNMISNSMKALKGQDNKLIKCTVAVEAEQLIILFSNNGESIDETDRYRIFDVFYTTTASQGGAGLGLFIVKSRLEAINGTIELIENELKPTGATFKIVMPFKK